jgi:hypothetical protein
MAEPSLPNLAGLRARLAEGVPSGGGDEDSAHH